jgi:formylglycine-generating enzyme required for sulfatase activity
MTTASTPMPIGGGMQSKRSIAGAHGRAVPRRRARARWIRACAVAFVAWTLVISPAHAGRRVALIIGNEAYPASPLKNPVADARLIEAVLRERLKFDAVTLVSNLDTRKLRLAINQFVVDSEGVDAAFLFFSGHGMQPSTGGRSYLLPVDANPQSDVELDSDGVAVDTIVQRLEDLARPARLRVVVLDACRNNPFSQRYKSQVKGLAALRPGDQYTLVGYATKEGSVADDGVGRHSPYAAALAKALEQADTVPVRRLFERTAAEVKKVTANRQLLRTYGDLPSEVLLLGGEVALDDGFGKSAAPSIDDELILWQGAERLATTAGYETYLKRYPKGRFADLAALNLDRLLQPPPKADPWAVGAVFKDCPECPEMVVIPEGQFLMGSPDTETGRAIDEGPQRRVQVERIAVGKYEVTFGQWKACVLDGACQQGTRRGGTWGGDDHPVVQIDWNDAQDYVDWVSRKTGQLYRLLTEAQWEYAARAGTTGPRWWGASDDETCRYANVGNPRTVVSRTNTFYKDAVHTSSDARCCVR